MAKFKFRPPIIKLHPKHIVFELVSRLAIITNDTRIPKFSRRNRIERKMVVGAGGERKLRRKIWKEEETRRRNEGSTQAGSRAHGVLASCTRWGSDLNLGLETWTGESSVVPPSTTPSPYFSRRPRKISIRCPRACCCTRCGGGRERGIIATALCNAVHSSRPREGDVGRALTEFPEPWKRCYGRKI